MQEISLQWQIQNFEEGGANRELSVIVVFGVLDFDTKYSEEDNK